MNNKVGNIIGLFDKRKDTQTTTEESIRENTLDHSSIIYDCIGSGLYEVEKMNKNSEKQILGDNNDIRTDITILKSKIENTNKIISIVGSGIGILVTVLIFAINAKYDAIKEINSSNMNEIRTEIKSINQRLDYQEKLNFLQIERDVNKEFIKTINKQ